jgi:hypothetical protein
MNTFFAAKKGRKNGFLSYRVETWMRKRPRSEKIWDYRLNFEVGNPILFRGSLKEIMNNTT